MAGEEGEGVEETGDGEEGGKEDGDEDGDEDAEGGVVVDDGTIGA